jgi:hypothetical protein
LQLAIPEYKYDTSTNSFIEFSTLPESALDIRATGNYLIVTTAASVYVYGEQLSLVRQINNVQVTGYSPVLLVRLVLTMYFTLVQKWFINYYNCHGFLK